MKMTYSFRLITAQIVGTKLLLSLKLTLERQYIIRSSEWKSIYKSIHMPRSTKNIRKIY